MFLWLVTLTSDLPNPTLMGVQYSSWNISKSSLVILATSVFEISCIKTDRQTQTDKRRQKPYPATAVGMDNYNGPRPSADLIRTNTILIYLLNTLIRFVYRELLWLWSAPSWRSTARSRPCLRPQPGTHTAPCRWDRSPWTRVRSASFPWPSSTTRNPPNDIPARSWWPELRRRFPAESTSLWSNRLSRPSAAELRACPEQLNNVKHCPLNIFLNFDSDRFFSGHAPVFAFSHFSFPVHVHDTETSRPQPTVFRRFPFRQMPKFLSLMRYNLFDVVGISFLGKINKFLWVSTKCS